MPDSTDPDTTVRDTTVPDISAVTRARDDIGPCDRRTLLRRLGLAAGVGGATALAAPLVGGDTAQAADGQSVILGHSNTADTFTQITNTDTSTSALWVVSGTRSGMSDSGAIVGDSSANVGVVGLSTAAAGVRGVSSQDAGVGGLSLGAGTAGVRGVGVDFGVQGLVPAPGNGVAVQGQGDAGVGVDGSANAGVGVQGAAAAAGGTGVAASAVAGATALRVSGVAQFSRSGTAVVARDKLSVVVTGVSLGTSSMVLATIQQAADGNAVSSVVTTPSTGSFKITLLKVVPAHTKIAWFVLN